MYRQFSGLMSAHCSIGGKTYRFY
uniref:Uncharacterized protein n=1 Tax=Arundo donax TaxID=35708 RepID=A0A0A9ALN1_ARUDO